MQPVIKSVDQIVWIIQQQGIYKNLLGYPKRIISDCLLWPSPPSTTSRLACTTGRKSSCCLFLRNKTLFILDKLIDYLRFWQSVWAVWQFDIAGICLRGAVGGWGHIVSQPWHLHCTKLLCQHTSCFGDKPAKWLYRWVPRGKFEPKQEQGPGLEWWWRVGEAQRRKSTDHYPGKQRLFRSPCLQIYNPARDAC